jgi:ABC-2 type transport system ATP-binding protein
MEPVLNVNNLVVKYKDFDAVKNVSFAVNEGEIFGIIGPNGAGKTSLVEAIEGLRKRSGGEVCVMGVDPLKNRTEAYAKIGVQLQETAYPANATVEEICKLFSCFYDNPVPYKELMAEIGFEGHLKKKVRSLSGGERQKLSILLALLGRPQLVFLDELTTGLDPSARHEVWDTLRKYKSKGISMVLITHFMDEIENLCDRVAVMKNGEMIKIGTPQEIIKAFCNERRVTFKAAIDNAFELFKGINSIKDIIQHNDNVEIIADSDSIGLEVAGKLSEHHIHAVDFMVHQANMEDAFLIMNEKG